MFAVVKTHIESSRGCELPVQSYIKSFPTRKCIKRSRNIDNQNCTICITVITL